MRKETNLSSVRSIPGRWGKHGALFVAAAGLLCAQGGDVLGHAYRLSPTQANHDALERFANAHANEQSGALAQLALGYVEADQPQPGDAAKHLTIASEKLVGLRDFAAYGQAVALHKHQEDAKVEAALAPVFAQPSSPLIAKAIPLAVDADLKSQRAPQALELVRRYGKDLSDRDHAAWTARTAEAVGDRATALPAWQKVYYLLPAQ